MTQPAIMSATGRTARQPSAFTPEQVAEIRCITIGCFNELVRAAELMKVSPPCGEPETPIVVRGISIAELGAIYPDGTKVTGCQAPQEQAV